MAKNKYLFYACFKNGHNGGVYCDGRKTAQEAEKDLIKLMNGYLTNDCIFMGIIKCSDSAPLSHIYALG